MEPSENNGNSKIFILKGSEAEDSVPFEYAKFREPDICETDVEILILDAVQVEIPVLMNIMKRFRSTLTEIRLTRIKLRVIWSAGEDDFMEWVKSAAREFRDSGRVYLPRLKVFEFRIAGHPFSHNEISNEAELEILSTFCFFDTNADTVPDFEQFGLICASGLDLNFNLTYDNRLDFAVYIQIDPMMGQIKSKLLCTNIVLQYYISAQLPLKDLQLLDSACKDLNPELIPIDLEKLDYQPNWTGHTSCVSVLSKCPNLKELVISTGDESVPISALPRSLKRLSLCRGSFTYSSGVQLELDYLNLNCLEDLNFDEGIDKDFSTIFNSKNAYAHCDLFDFTHFLKMERIEDLTIQMSMCSDGFSEDQIQFLQEFGITEIPSDPYSGRDGFRLVKETSNETGDSKWKILHSAPWGAQN